VLDPKKRELWSHGERVALEPKVFDLLLYLVQHRDRVVGKDDLLQAVWQGRIVSDSALTTRLNAARRALGDNGEKQSLIRTLPRKGVRFVAEVEEAPDDIHRTGPEPPSMLPDRPSIAVLPFANIGGDPAQEYFADGMAEEIITALSRIRWLFVIARNSSFTYKGKAIDAKQAGRELGVRYVLEGSVRKGGNGVRITAQLADAATGASLWADRFDGTLEDVFELQDRVASEVAGVIEPTMETVEMQRSAQRAPSELTPYDFYLRALQGCYSCDSQQLFRALDLLERAIECDPAFGPVLAAAAGCRQFLGCAGWIDEWEANRLKAVELARRALQADSEHPAVLTESARVLAYFTAEIDSAIALLERALTLNPSHARAWYWNGWVRLFTGQPDLATEHFRTSMRLNPRHRPYLTGMGAAHFFNRRYPEAVEALLASLGALPGWPTTYRFLIASYVQLEQLEEAREGMIRLRAITPTPLHAAECAGNSPFRNREQRALYLEALSLAAGMID